MTQIIVTADSAGARLIGSNEGRFYVIEALDHPDGRLHNAEINADKPGRVGDRHGGAPHTLEAEESPHQRKVADFARQLCARLDRGRQQGELKSLVICAEPHLLGILRSTLDKNTAALVSQWLNKDLQKVPLHDLAGHLGQGR